MAHRKLIQQEFNLDTYYYICVLQHTHYKCIIMYKKSTLNIHWKDWCWSWSSNTLATWCEELTHWKDLDAGKDWRLEEKADNREWDGWWHHQFNEHESEQTLRDSEGQETLACCSSWGHKESDTTSRLNNKALRLL